jgi:hypothetical protein
MIIFLFHLYADIADQHIARLDLRLREARYQKSDRYWLSWPPVGAAHWAGSFTHDDRAAVLAHEAEMVTGRHLSLLDDPRNDGPATGQVEGSLDPEPEGKRSCRLAHHRPSIAATGASTG